MDHVATNYHLRLRRHVHLEHFGYSQRRPLLAPSSDTALADAICGTSGNLQDGPSVDNRNAATWTQYEIGQWFADALVLRPQYLCHDSLNKDEGSNRMRPWAGNIPMAVQLFRTSNPWSCTLRVMREPTNAIPSPILDAMALGMTSTCADNIPKLISSSGQLTIGRIM